MKYFNLDSLIDKYSVDFTVISSSEGSYNDLGEWVNGSIIEVKKRGAILGMTDTKLYRAEGILTEKDKQLFMKDPLGCDFNKAHVVYNGIKYKVENQPNDNSQYTGVYSYTLKFVSAFGGGVSD